MNTNEENISLFGDWKTVNDLDMLCLDYTNTPTPLIRLRLADKGFSNEQVIEIMKVVCNICPECWDYDRPCG
jgi:hypothetical protein